MANRRGRANGVGSHILQWESKTRNYTRVTWWWQSNIRGGEIRGARVWKERRGNKMAAATSKVGEVRHLSINKKLLTLMRLDEKNDNTLLNFLKLAFLAIHNWDNNILMTTEAISLWYDFYFYMHKYIV